MTYGKEAIKNLIESSAKIFVATEPSADEATTFAALALKNILESAEKGVFLSPAPKESFVQKFRGLIPEQLNSAIPQKIKIKIPKNVPLEEMSYEEEDEFLNLIISPKIGLEPSSLTIEKSPYEMDMAFCFFASEEGWKKISAPVAKPPQEKIVYFSNKNTTFAEKASGISGALGTNSVSPETATLLYGSLIFETDNFQLKQSKEVFGLARDLLETGADKNALKEILSSDKKSNVSQLIGRALARTTAEEELKTSWTFLTQKDFLKTGIGATKENLLFILRKVRSQISPTPCSILCYENGEDVGSLVFHENENILKGLSLGLGASPESLYFFVSGFKNFSEAEGRILTLLKETLSAKIK